jgi:hypothetical protein
MMVLRYDKLGRCLSILLILALSLTTPVSAIDTAIIEGELPDVQEEGTSVNFTIEVDGFPVQTDSIVLETDLVPAGEAPVWQISGSEQLNGTDPEGNYRTQQIELGVEGALTRPFEISVAGTVPIITEVKQVDGLVITERDSRRSGYTYYRIQALDGNGIKVGNAVTDTYTIVIPEELAFQDRLNQVSDTELRSLIQELYDKGLEAEAIALLEYAERPIPASVSLWIVVVGVVLVGAIGFVAGQRRGITIERKNRYIKGDER